MEKYMGWWKLLAWHRKHRFHPIFNPEYARENLASLLETIAMALIYILIISLSINLLAVLGYIQTESVLTLYASQIYEPFAIQVGLNNILGCIITIVIYSILALVIRESFEVYKATQHPKN